MKIKLTILLAVLGMFGNIQATNNIFCYTYEGKTLEYEVIDEELKTCATRSGYMDPVFITAIYAGNDVSGTVIIPEIVSDGTNEYTVVAIGDLGFSNCALDTVILPNTIQTIGKMSFYGTRITDIDFPASLTEIKNAAFSLTYLTEIVLPENVKKLGLGVFDGFLNKIRVEAPVPPQIDPDTFYENVYKDAMLIVPDESLETYRNAPNWNKFVNLESGVEEISASAPEELRRYTTDGVQVDENYKGIVIIQYSDGTTAKRFVE